MEWANCKHVFKYEYNFSLYLETYRQEGLKLKQYPIHDGFTLESGVIKYFRLYLLALSL